MKSHAPDDDETLGQLARPAGPAGRAETPVRRRARQALRARPSGRPRASLERSNLLKTNVAVAATASCVLCMRMLAATGLCHHELCNCLP
jgi:hypothetical protein